MDIEAVEVLAELLKDREDEQFDLEVLYVRKDE